MQALNEKGICPGVISDSSKGVIAGAFYCDGYSPKKILNKKELFNYFEFGLPKRGLLKITDQAKILRKHP